MIIIITKKTSPYYRHDRKWWISRRFPTCHSIEFQFFSLFLTPSKPISFRLSREKITNSLSMGGGWSIFIWNSFNNLPGDLWHNIARCQAQCHSIIIMIIIIMIIIIMIIIIRKKTSPYYRHDRNWWISRRFPTCHSIEFQFFSLFLTPKPISFRLSREKITNSLSMGGGWSIFIWNSFNILPGDLWRSNNIARCQAQCHRGKFLKLLKNDNILQNCTRLLPYHDIPDFITTFRVKCRDFQTYCTRIWFGIQVNFPVLFWNFRFFPIWKKHSL